MKLKPRWTQSEIARQAAVAADLATPRDLEIDPFSDDGDFVMPIDLDDLFVDNARVFVPLALTCNNA